MEADTAVLQLSALAQSARLAVFQRLVRAGPAGLAAGEIAEALGCAPNTLSAQLKLLTQAGLTSRQRQGRSVVYRADYPAISRLILFLMQDCCAGRAEVCMPVLAAEQGTATRAARRHRAASQDRKQ